MRVLFRTDASHEIGTGHVMRCLTLAEALRRGGAEVGFVCRELPGNLIERIRCRQFALFVLPAPNESTRMAPPDHAAWAQVGWARDAEETRSILSSIAPDWLIVDHYAFDRRWETSLRKNNMRIMVIDDLANRSHDCDLLLDQNLGRAKKDYQSLVPSHCCLLIGQHFALLRPEFAARRSESLLRRRSGQVKSILVFMGGIDRDNVTARVLRVLEESDFLEECRVKVVLGENAPWFDQVFDLASQSTHQTRVLQNVTDMATLMLNSDLAIGGAGTTSWERCCLGLPTLIVTMAENQRRISKALIERAAATYGGDQNSCDFERGLRDALESYFTHSTIRKQSQCAAELCDGDGAARVCNHILEPEIEFRDAEITDSRRIWEWRLFPGHERFSRHAASPTFTEHHQWLERALLTPRLCFRILQRGSLPCGYVRLDFENPARASISICLAVDSRGKSLACELLCEAEKQANLRGATFIDADIHIENAPSIHVFSSAGYKNVGVFDNFLRYERRVGDPL